MSPRPRAAIASRVALAMLGAILVSACDADAQNQPQRQTIVIANKRADVDCDAVAAKIPSILFAYDPGYFAFAATIRPKVRESCIEDAWPEPLRRCIVTTTPDKLVHDHACDAQVPGELAAKVATRFGVAPQQVQAMLGR